MNQSILHAKQIPIRGEVLTWAGDCPWTSGLCFGTESGRLIFESGKDRFAIFDLPELDAPINGVAFHGSWVGLSTRGQIALAQRHPPELALQRPFELAYDGGAHGIVRSAGGFLAPLGVDGLLMIDVADGGYLTKIGKGPHNYYKVARLGNLPSGEVLRVQRGRKAWS